VVSCSQIIEHSISHFSVHHLPLGYLLVIMQELSSDSLSPDRRFGFRNLQGNSGLFRDPSIWEMQGHMREQPPPQCHKPLQIINSWLVLFFSSYQKTRMQITPWSSGPKQHESGKDSLGIFSETVGLTQIDYWVGAPSSASSSSRSQSHADHQARGGPPAKIAERKEINKARSECQP
jgi:hypothetical protein